MPRAMVIAAVDLAAPAVRADKLQHAALRNAMPAASGGASESLLHQWVYGEGCDFAQGNIAVSLALA